jgi:hypothetical protein
VCVFLTPLCFISNTPHRELLSSAKAEHARTVSALRDRLEEEIAGRAKAEGLAESLRAESGERVLGA